MQSPLVPGHDSAPSWLPEGWFLWAASTLVILALAIFVRWLFGRRFGSASGWRFRLQVLTLALSGLVVVGSVLSIPADELRGQLLQLLGILLSAAIALSSTTLLGNAMAGLMLRFVGSYRIGDFLRVEEHFGRVTEQGLLHTEIQTEDRDLETLPNAYLVGHPVRVLRASGTILSATVSLGYDVARVAARDLLLVAATEAGLEDPFVEIQDLGDFSVSYRAAGMLRDPKKLLTVRSALRARILDAFHGAGIEIVSPSFMNQRQIAAEQRFIPAHQDEPSTAELPEAVIFDKAEHAEQREKLRTTFDELGKEVDALEQRLAAASGETERERLQARVERRRAHRERVGAVLAQWESRESS